MEGRGAVTGVENKDHHGSHRGLLWAHDDLPPCRATVDAIVVPTVRQPAYLRSAASLAVRLGCPLVTLHSRKWTNAWTADLQIPPAVDLVAIDVPERSTLRLPESETSGLLAGTRFARRTDTSDKRKLALMLCGTRLACWALTTP
jgi:hypothetical protein